MKYILTVLSLSVLIFASCQSKPGNDVERGNYVNREYGFSLNIPEGYGYVGEDGFLQVLATPTEENETPLPEFRLQITEGSDVNVAEQEGVTVVDSNAIIVNGIEGVLTTVTYSFYPEGNECPIYRFANDGFVYDFSLHECLESPIFEDVVSSFQLID